MKRLVLTVGSSRLEFTFPRARGPFPYLLEFGNLREAARAGNLTGIAAGESSSLTVKLDNPQGKVARIVRRPLRARAEIFDDDVLYFAGYVGPIVYGREIDITVEA